MMVGTLVRVGQGKESTHNVKKRLQSRQRSHSNGRVVAPAEGLFLVRVRY
jgi:tRNA U38,U39,U40 pseudouridine synthase TruA